MISSCNLNSSFLNSLSNLTWSWILDCLSSSTEGSEDVTALSWSGGEAEQIDPILEDGNKVLLDVEVLVILSCFGSH